MSPLVVVLGKIGVFGLLFPGGLAGHFLGNAVNNGFIGRRERPVQVIYPFGKAKFIFHQIVLREQQYHKPTGFELAGITAVRANPMYHSISI